MYIADYYNNRVRKVTVPAPTATPSVVPSSMPTYTPTTLTPSISPNSISIISTIAGTGSSSYSGDGGAATSATINGPFGITVDSSANVYFSDYYNHRVRKITVSTGIISTYAGTGSATYSGDGGVASSAALSYPNGLCIDLSGTHRYVVFLFTFYIKLL